MASEATRFSESGTVTTDYTAVGDPVVFERYGNWARIRVINAAASDGTINGFKLQGQEHPNDDPAEETEWVDYIVSWTVLTDNLRHVSGNAPDTLAPGEIGVVDVWVKNVYRLRAVAKVAADTATVTWRGNES
jgi:hypothetical protein